MKTFNPIIPKTIFPHRVVCGFTTRTGGVSPPPFDSLNLGSETADDPVNVRLNRSAVYCRFGVDEHHVALMNQVHGNGVAIASAGAVYPQTDGLVTIVPGVFLGVLAADCVPVLMYDPAGNAAGAIHCGWRSIVGGIAERTVSLMADTAGTRPENVLVILGPSAAPCCYEIGVETATRLNPAAVIRRNGKRYGDLKTELCRRLLTCGISGEHIEDIPDCTICGVRDYFSHRRDGSNAGRMMGFIMIRNTD